jgi:quercetin dioxygenase-like cupin family protein
MERKNVLEVPRSSAVRAGHGVGNTPLEQLMQTDILMLTVLDFKDGSRTGWHAHPDADQFLYWISGDGAVGIDDEVTSTRPGDLVKIPAGAKHWHGARRGKDAQHLSILSGKESSVWFDEDPDPVD